MPRGHLPVRGGRAQGPANCSPEATCSLPPYRYTFIGTQPHPFVCASSAPALTLRWRGRAVAMGTLCPAEPTIFIIWPFIKKKKKKSVPSLGLEFCGRSLWDLRDRARCLHTVRCHGKECVEWGPSQVTPLVDKLGKCLS